MFTLFVRLLVLSTKLYVDFQLTLYFLIPPTLSVLFKEKIIVRYQWELKTPYELQTRLISYYS
jgi:TRAP-type mannitol/chloroaromatic compound transport system permease small subunit